MKFPGRALFPLLLAVAPGLAWSQPAPETGQRQVLLFDDGWLFQKNDPAGTAGKLSYEKMKDWILPTANDFVADPAARATRPLGEPGAGVSYTLSDFDDHAWRPVTLPHDWAIEGPFDPSGDNASGLRHYWGVGWYRKHFRLPAEDAGKEIFLDIDGAMSYATVWINGHCAGGWPYGYASFEVDLTPYIQPGKDNLVAVRLDNPPRSARWYPGAGIYRNVYLVKTAPAHLGHWGVQITTPQISDDAAIVVAKSTIANSMNSASQVEVQTQLYALDANGSVSGDALATSEWTSCNIPAGASASTTEYLRISRPQLWAPEHPNLYTAVTLVRQNGAVLDRQQTNFGVRSIRFDPEHGFFLNGQHVVLHGVCLHSDLGALGTAVNRRGLQRQIEIMKEMGANAIRTSHNPPSPELVDLCNRMGMMMLAETFDCWDIGKRAQDYHVLFNTWSEPDLRSALRHYRNDPCIVLWGIGNEVTNENLPSGVTIGKRLTAIAHEEDPTRETTVACNAAAGGWNGFQDGVDVFGYNYRQTDYAKFHSLHPSQPLLGTETSSTVSSRGEYFLPPSIKAQNFQVTSYDTWGPKWSNLPDVEFAAQEKNDFVAGEFVWTGFDYLGEPNPFDRSWKSLIPVIDPAEKPQLEEDLKNKTPWVTPSRSSYFGIVDLAGFKKDRFYLYQSHWRPDFPMAHLLPHWNWPGMNGQTIPVYLYTSGDEAELFLNGRSLGRKSKKPLTYRLEWDVPYEPGELHAVAYKQGKEWAQDTVKTTGEVSQIQLEPDRSSLQADGDDLSYVTVRLADRAGVTVPGADNSVHLAIRGPADIVGVDNGDATDLSSFQANDKKAFHGLLMVIVRTRVGQPGDIVLQASSEGLTAGQVSLSSH